MPQYGNVPEEDVSAIQGAVRAAQTVARYLPPTAPPAWQEVAYEAVLDGILRDWVMNGTNELDETDEQDLTDLLRVAVDTALAQPDALRDATFRTVVRNAMQDWVENWNADEDE